MAEVNAPTDKEYTEIIKSDVDADPSYIKDEGQPAKIVYYCRTCKKIVPPTRIGKKLSFRCSECNTEYISFGTEQSVSSYYNIK